MNTHLYHSDIRSNVYMMSDVVKPNKIVYVQLKVLSTWNAVVVFAAAYKHLKLVFIHNASVPVFCDVGVSVGGDYNCWFCK